MCFTITIAIASAITTLCQLLELPLALICPRCLSLPVGGRLLQHLLPLLRRLPTHFPRRDQLLHHAGVDGLRPVAAQDLLLLLQLLDGVRHAEDHVGLGFEDSTCGHVGVRHRAAAAQYGEIGLIPFFI